VRIIVHHTPRSPTGPLSQAESHYDGNRGAFSMRYAVFKLIAAWDTSVRLGAAHDEGHRCHDRKTEDGYQE
jgi:hypothetical protein